MTLVALPASTSLRSKVGRWTWLAAPAVALLATGTYWFFTRTGSADDPVFANPVYHVTPLSFDMKIAKDGELQAVNNIDITNDVEGQTTINTVVKEGSSVKKGDVLMTLDASGIKQKIDDLSLQLKAAENDVTAASEMKEIQVSQNSANLAGAQVALQLAQIDLKQYEEGSYPQLIASAKSDRDMATLTLNDKQEDLSQTRALFAKGFVTATDIKKGELDVTTAKAAVDKAATALKVLTEYTHQMDETSKRNALTQAEQTLVRTQRENAANLEQKSADAQAKAAALDILRRRMDHLKDQLASCTIAAPADGLVVYASSNDRNSQNPIQEGGTARERQALLRLPDTSAMKAVVRIQEGQVTKLRVGQRAQLRIVGVPQPVGATLTSVSVLSDSSQRWWNPDLKEYPVDLTLDQTLPALKPGMGAQADIFLDHVDAAAAVPLAAIYSAGNDAYVFTRLADQVQPTKVKVGRTNETHAEIIDGLTAGQDVVLLQVGQGQELLERAGIKTAPATQPSDDQPHRHHHDHGAATTEPATPARG